MWEIFQLLEALEVISCRAACQRITDDDVESMEDTGAPKLHNIEHLLEKPANPFNTHEPVDSSAAAITVQGLLRLGHYLQRTGKNAQGSTYWQAGLTIFDALLQEPYISTQSEHEGLILHSLYHRPNGWDLIPDGQQVPCGEATMWGDYHAREAALYLQRIINNEPYYTFFSNYKDWWNAFGRKCDR